MQIVLEKRKLRHFRFCAVAACLISGVMGASGQTTSPNPAEAEDGADSAVVLSPYEVTTKQDHGYMATNAVTATRIAMSVQDLPFSISILNADFINDMQLFDNDSAFRYMLGNDNNGAPHERQFSRMRGFQQTEGSTLRNSFRYNGIKDNFNVERIEIVRGPNSTIVGSADPGGQINTITKNATIGHDFGEVDVKTGAYNLFRTTVDYNKSFSLGEVPMALRINLLRHASDDFIPFAQIKNTGLALNYLAQLTPKTTLNIDFESTRQRTQEETGLPDRWAAGAGIVGFGGFFDDLRDVAYKKIPNAGTVVGSRLYTTGAYVSNVYSYEDAQVLSPDNQREHDSDYINLTLDQRITPNWHVRLEGSLSRDLNNYSMQARGAGNYGYTGYTVGAGNVVSYDPTGARYYQIRSWQQLINAKFDTTEELRLTSTYDLDLSWMKQVITFGADVSRTEPPDSGNWIEELRGANGKFLELPVYMDDLSAQQVGIQRWLDTPGINWFKQNPAKGVAFDNKGAFLSLAGSYLGGHVRTLLGVRRDVTHATTYTGSWGDAAQTVQVFDVLDEATTSATSPLYSISFLPTKSVSIYYTRSESYKPSSVNRRSLKVPVNSLDPFGPSLPPETGVGDEVGLKLDMFQHKLALSMGVFDITKFNITKILSQTIVQDLFNDPGENRRFLIPGVSARSRGVELEIIFNPTPKLSLMGGYAYLNSINLHDPSQPTRDGSFSDVSYKNSGYFVMKYTETEDMFRGFYAGMGTVMRGRLYLAASRPGVTAPPYIVFNPFFGYQKRLANGMTLGAAVSIENLLNLEYAKNYSRLGSPRATTLSLSLRF